MSFLVCFLQKAFKSLDEDRNGYFSSFEFRRVLNSVGKTNYIITITISNSYYILSENHILKGLVVTHQELSAISHGLHQLTDKCSVSHMTAQDQVM